MKATTKQLRYCKRSRDTPPYVAHADFFTHYTFFNGVTRGVTPNNKNSVTEAIKTPLNKV